MKQLAITIMGANTPSVMNEICKLAASSGSSIISCHTTTLGSEFVSNILLGGTWNALAKFETGIPPLEQKHHLRSIIQRTEAQKYSSELLPYAIHITAPDQSGVVYKITNFFAENNININLLSVLSYVAPYSSTNMVSITMSVSIPLTSHIADLRERFTLLCDDLNMDAVMEPEKN